MILRYEWVSTTYLHECVKNYASLFLRYFRVSHLSHPWTKCQRYSEYSTLILILISTHSHIIYLVKPATYSVVDIKHQLQSIYLHPFWVAQLDYIPSCKPWYLLNILSFLTVKCTLTAEERAHFDTSSDTVPYVTDAQWQP